MSLWIYAGSPSDLVQALTDRSWDEDVSDYDRILLESAALVLQSTLDRCIKLASSIEKNELGL